MGPYYLPKRVNVALQRFGFRQRRLEMPSIVTVGWRPRAAAFAFAMKVRWLDAEPLADFLKRKLVAVNAQRRAEAEVVRFIRLFAIEETLNVRNILGSSPSLIGT